MHGIEIVDANLAADGMAIDQIRITGGSALADWPDAVITDIERALRRQLAITARLLRRAKSYRFQRTAAARLVERAVIVDNEVSSSATVLERALTDRVPIGSPVRSSNSISTSPGRRCTRSATM